MVSDLHIHVRPRYKNTVVINDHAYTDTEFALRLAISMGAECITVLGGTGSRLDHVLGNIELLGIGLELGVEIELLDANNRIRMTDHGMVLKKEEQFGKYVSLIPYTAQVEHLYLAGFKYPLADYCLKGFCSIGVSNEITEEQAEITWDYVHFTMKNRPLFL